jgi:hypothetical protein
MNQAPRSFDLCLFPAGIAPNGTTTNFENPETLVPVLISICVIMSTGAVFFTAFRLVANKRKLSWSDCKKAPASGPSIFKMDKCFKTD